MRKGGKVLRREGKRGKKEREKGERGKNGEKDEEEKGWIFLLVCCWLPHPSLEG